MPTFAYTATNSSNKAIEGTLDTTDKAAVIAALTKQGLRPISIKEKSGGQLKMPKSGGFLGGKV